MLTRRRLPCPPELEAVIAGEVSEPLLARLASRLSGRLSRREALARDLADGVEELVIAPEAVAVHRVTGGGPFVFLAVGAQTVLLAGDWMYDVVTDDGQELEPHTSWPRVVRVLRFSTSGKVIKFEIVDSTPMSVQLTAPVLSDFRETCVLVGGLSDFKERVEVKEVVWSERPKDNAIESTLLEILADCRGLGVPDAELDDMVALTKAGEPGIALENLCEQLFEHDVHVSHSIVQRIAFLGSAMGLRDDYWERLAPK
jgi:hypothetical protein